MRIKILKFLTTIAVLAAIFSACLIDSDSNIPYIVCLISISWLGLILWANMPEGGR